MRNKCELRINANLMNYNGHFIGQCSMEMDIGHKQSQVNKVRVPKFLSN